MLSHLCQPSRLAGRTKAHGTPAGTEVTCHCGKRWRITRTHYTPTNGRRGAICGCGWERIDEPKVGDVIGHTGFGEPVTVIGIDDMEAAA